MKSGHSAPGDPTRSEYAPLQREIASEGRIFPNEVIGGPAIARAPVLPGR